MILEQLQGNIIVSCQALEHEPLYGSRIMARMAVAAQEGGAKGIRANGISDIVAIKEVVDLPIIGIIKEEYDGSDVYITPTLKEVKLLCEAGVEMIATDFTKRKRPKESLTEMVSFIRERYPTILIMADCSCEEDVDYAAALQADIIGTTLSGYTKETAGIDLPNIGLVKYASTTYSIPVFCEGGIRTTGDVQAAFESGAHCCVIGGAITRPQEITKYFIQHKRRL